MVSAYGFVPTLVIGPHPSDSKVVLLHPLEDHLSYEFSSPIPQSLQPQSTPKFGPLVSR